MAVYHSTSAKVAATDAVVDLLDLGASDPTLKFYALGTNISTPGTVAATLTMNSTAAFGPANVSTGIATANGITQDSNATGNANAVDHAGLCDGSGNIIIYCAVAASGSDINMSNGLTIGAGDTVSCTSLTYRALAQ